MNETCNGKKKAAQIGVKEIARQANVSIGTVDRVLHNLGGKVISRHIIFRMNQI